MSTIQMTMEQGESPSLPHAFVDALAALVRAANRETRGGDASAVDLLEGYILTKEARRTIPIIGDPDPETLAKVELFYRAVGRIVEARSGLTVSLMMKMSHEGFGRVLLTSGKLVAFAKSLRDVHRFGYDGLEALDREGEKAAAQALAAIATYPAAARA